MKTRVITAILMLYGFFQGLNAQVNNLEDFNANYSIYTNSLYNSGEEVGITLSAYNISKRPEFKFTIYKIKDVEGFFSRQTSNYSIDVLSKDSTNLLALCEEVDSFNKTFKTEGYSDYRYFYETVNYKPKTKGAFVVRASYKNKVAYGGFFITDIGMMSQASSNGLLAFTVDRKTGEPINDVGLNFYLGSKKIGIGNTAGGLFYKALEEVDRKYAADHEIYYPLVIGSKGDDIAISDPYLYFGYSANFYSVYITTNQPVYRPKLTVDFKGTVRKRAGGGFDNPGPIDVTVKIRDTKGAEVYKQVLKSNDNGSFTGSYDVPDNAALGQYYIYAELGKGQVYSAFFNVEEYKKPEYKVDVTLDKDQYTDGDNLKGVVHADYYFGSPVQDAEVTYNIYKKTFYKPWWYFSDYRWWYEDYYANMDDNQRYNDADFIYSGKGTLDKEGRFDFDYNIKEDFKAKYNYYWYYYDYDNKGYYETDFIYIIQAKVVDKSRREITSTKTVYVTRAEFYLVANTDKYLYKPDEKVTLEVRAADFGDQPKAVTFDATVNKLTWGSYPDYKQKKEFVTAVSGSTNDKGYGAVSFDAAGDGYYSIEVKSYDNRGKKVTTETYCYVSTGDMWWWYNQSGTVQIYPDKDSYKPGEICKALVVVTNPGVSVLISTYNNDILTYRVEKFESTSNLIEFTVDDNSAPNFTISASYVSKGIFYSNTKSVMVIPEKKFLNVTIGTDKTTYKPKEDGTFLVKVTDNNGNAVSNAEVSIGIVDESIYAIKPENAKDIRQFFYSPVWSGISTHYSSQYYYYGYSRLITIYERFNIKNMSETELGTIKGRLTNKAGDAIPYATIVIDGDFIAATTGDDGSYEFKLPEGSYTISVLKGKKSSEGERDLVVKKGKTIEVNFRVDRDEIIMDGLYYQTNDLGADQQQSGIVSETRSLQQPSEKSKELNGKVSDKKNGVYKKGEDKDDSFVEAELRSDFRDAILWQPTVTTDENGYATIKIKFPDNLTTWRTTARVITADTKVGQQVNTVITRKDLLVRMETPRFFQQNDEVTISTIIHNYLETDKETKLSFKVENLQVEGDAGDKVFTMKKNEEKRIDWKVRVTEPMGFAKLTATALTNEESDAVELKVPLQPHGLQLADFQAMDVSDPEKTEYKYVEIPKYTDLRSTKLTLNVAPSLASTMLTALDELVGYPYGCVEQTMSRFLPTVIVANTYKDLNAPISEATQKDLPKMVEAGYNRLYSMQHYDGGWGWWTNDQSHPFMTSYVVYGLALGDMAGYSVRKDVLKNGVKSIRAQLKDKNIDATTRSYMIYAMSHVEPDAKDVYEEQFRYLFEAELNDYAVALISMTARNIGDMETAKKFNEKLVKNVQASGESAAYWGGQVWHYNWQDDKIQTTAMAVKALVNDPLTLKDNTELMNKAIRWLMMQRQGGGWWNTQSTAFIIYAMVDYLKTSKELEPDYSVKIYVNNELYLDKHMTKADIFEKEGKIEITGSKLKDGINEVRIEKSGQGKVYVASDLRYYTNEEKIHPRENGFRVEKEYYKLEQYTKYNDNKIIYRKRYFDGSVKSGDIIFVKVKVTAKEQNNQYFMLEDPIPAGCEVVKDDWAYTIDEEKDYSGYTYYWWRWWYSDKDIRDNRVTFFSTYMYGDTYEFTYILRAQIPGVYNVIPATGMLMYYPDVRGSSEELKIEITD